MNQQKTNFWDNLTNVATGFDVSEKQSVQTKLVEDSPEEIKKILVAYIGAHRQCVSPGNRNKIPESKYKVLREYIATGIYGSWKSTPGWVRWAEGGNSNKQEQARSIASMFLDQYVYYSKNSETAAAAPESVFTDMPAIGEPYGIRSLATADLFEATHGVYNKLTGELVYQGTESKCAEITPVLILGYRQGVQHSSGYLAEIAKRLSPT